MISVVVVGTTVLHGKFLRREKEALIDQQVRETATALLDSELGDLRKVEFEKVESILSEELGENRIGKFFVIRNNAGEILFESAGAKLLPISELPRKPRWITIQEKGKYIRLLNLSLPKIPDRTLQVGLVIGQELLSPGYFSRANLFFTAAIMLGGLFLAWMLTTMLMRPISWLSNFIGLAAQDSGQKLELPPLPKDLKSFVTKSNSKDELVGLLAGFENLIERVNRDYKMSRVWSYQMAHELKTPMALIEAKITEGQRLGAIKDPLAKDILMEVFEISETITAFLAWAELENSTGQKRLFVVSIAKVLQGLRQRFEVTFPGRIEIRITEDFNVMTNIQHLEHAVGNIILNALIYSTLETKVVIESSANSIRVHDLGSGIPTTVVERLGEPFNKGSHSTLSESKGHGLGLALVQSICRIYEWRLNISTGSNGSCVSIAFPAIQSELVSYNG
ncbi:MAG: HAMP domain-containing histidine kinase [Bdellovibrionales bacterium]|nr:HAMP domain-containing histidine kinase [Bdellovibrionales bacterium]